MSEKIKYDKITTVNGSYKTTLNEMYRCRKPWKPVNPKHLLSYIPGTVISLNVKAGQKVSEGDELMLFKAMKMDNRILSPLTGKVKAVYVKVGDTVPKGALMIEFE